MDSILGNQLFFTFQEEPEYDLAEKVSTWILDGDMIRPSVSLGLLPKFHPGIYKVDVNRDFGYFCKRVNMSSDELFNFSNSVIPSLVDEVNKFWDKSEEYKESKIVHKRGILFFGYPGCGKTSIVTLLCNELIRRKGVVFNVTGPENLQVYINFIKNNFRQIEPNTPIITIIEDLENYTDSSALLDFLDGKSQIEHHLVIATTNNTRDLPNSFLRPSRIDLKVEVAQPSDEVRKEYLKHKNLEESLINEIVEKTNKFSFADLKELYIAIKLLDYSVDEAVARITLKDVKKDFSSKSLKTNNIGL